MTRKILITGAGGMLGSELARQIPSAVAHTRNDLDITDAVAVQETMQAVKPDVVINCAAYTRVDDAEANEETARNVNVRAVEVLAAECVRHNAQLVYPSTDYVFDGGSDVAYTPEHETNPINVYGRTKLEGEIVARNARHLIVRTSWLYGPGGRNFVRTVVDRMQDNKPMRVVDDQRGAPTWTVDLASIIIKLIAADATGTLHVAGRGETTWFEVAGFIAAKMGKEQLISACSSEEFPAAATRPQFSLLDCSATEALVGAMPDWRASLNTALETIRY